MKTITRISILLIAMFIVFCDLTENNDKPAEENESESIKTDTVFARNN